MDEYFNLFELCVENDVYIDLKFLRVEILLVVVKCVSKSGKWVAVGVLVTFGDVFFVFKGCVGEGVYVEVYEVELESKVCVFSEEDVGVYVLKV